MLKTSPLKINTVSNEACQSANASARLDRLPMTKFQLRLFMFIALAWLFDSIDLGMMTFVLAPIKEHFQLTAAQTGLVGSASFGGMLVGAALSGMIADKIGRKIVFQWSIVIWATASFLSAISWDMYSLIAFRFLVGFGMGAEFPIAQSMVSEMIPSKDRGRYLAFLEGFWPIGFITAGIIAYFILPIASWQGAFVAQGLPGLYVLWIRRKLPESARWFESKGRYKEADEVVTYFETEVKKHTGGVLPPVEEKADSITRTAEHSSLRQSFKEIWSPEYRKRTLMVWILWFFVLFGYYSITTWLGALMVENGFSITKSTQYIILMSLPAIPGFILAGILVEKWGRKPTLITYVLMSALCAKFYGSATDFQTLISWGAAMQFFMFGVWSCLYAYTPELYPTRSRATGCGFASSIGRLGALLGPYIVGVVINSSGNSGVFMLGVIAFVVAAAGVFFLGPETKGKSLEEISH